MRLSCEMLASRTIAETSAEATPTSAVVYVLAATAQNPIPSSDVATVESMSAEALRTSGVGPVALSMLSVS